MTRQRLKTLFCFLLFFLLVPVCLSPVSAHVLRSYPGAAPLRIAILPCMDPVVVYKKFHPLAHYLEGKINRRVILHVPGDYKDFKGVLETRQVDFVYLSAHIYQQLCSRFSREPSLTVLTPDGRPQHQGLLVTRSDSGIERVEDLRGRTLLFGAEQSTVKTLAARRLLREHGIDPDRDLKKYSYGSSCQKNAFNVFLRAYDATFICSYSTGVLNGGNPDWPITPGSMKVVARTMVTPTWIFAALDQVPAELVREVNTALLALDIKIEAEAKILHGIESSGFSVTDEEALRLLDEEFRSP